MLLIVIDKLSELQPEREPTVAANAEQGAMLNGVLRKVTFIHNMPAAPGTMTQLSILL
jgi:hypothetical protein